MTKLPVVTTTLNRNANEGNAINFPTNFSRLEFVQYSPWPASTVYNLMGTCNLDIQYMYWGGLCNDVAILELKLDTSTLYKGSKIKL